MLYHDIACIQKIESLTGALYQKVLFGFTKELFHIHLRIFNGISILESHEIFLLDLETELTKLMMQVIVKKEIFLKNLIMSEKRQNMHQELEVILRANLLIEYLIKMMAFTMMNLIMSLKRRNRHQGLEVLIKENLLIKSY